MIANLMIVYISTGLSFVTALPTMGAFPNYFAIIHGLSQIGGY